MKVINHIKFTENPYDHGKPVRVYWNFHRKCFSIQQNRLVIGYCNLVSLIDVKFTVSEAGRQRVLKGKTKNVHAYSVGMLQTPKNRFWDIRFNPHAPFKVVYNPYKHTHFCLWTKPEVAVHKAPSVLLYTKQNNPVILISS